MKKHTLLALPLCALALAPGALAATVNMNASSFEENQLGKLEVMVLEASADAEITAEHGIAILLPQKETFALWNNNPLWLLGTAVENGRMEALIQPQFSADYKTLYLPVMEDFKEGEKVLIQNLTLKTYWQHFGYRTLAIDLNGDGLADLERKEAFRVEDESNTDHIPPYPVANLSYQLLPNNAVQLAWQNPPDYDFEDAIVSRSLNGGAAVPVYSGKNPEYTDQLPADADSVVYFVSTKDLYNVGEPIEIAIILNQDPPEDSEQDESQPPAQEKEGEEETPPQETGQDSPSPADQQELAELSKLLNYYKIRYFIKCLPGGVPAYWGNGFCLWAKIDLAYAQQKLDQPDVAVAFTDQQKTVMKGRLVYSRARHQANCVDAAMPAAYCQALGKALMRAEYFLEQWGEA